MYETPDFIGIEIIVCNSCSTYTGLRTLEGSLEGVLLTTYEMDATS